MQAGINFCLGLFGPFAVLLFVIIIKAAFN